MQISDVKAKQLQKLEKHIDDLKQPFQMRIKSLKPQLVQFMYDNFMETFTEFDHYCRYNGFSYAQTLQLEKLIPETKQTYTLEEIRKIIANSHAQQQMDSIAFNTLKSKNNNKYKKEEKNEEKKTFQTLGEEQKTITVREKKVALMIIQVKEEDLYQSIFYQNESHNNSAKPRSLLSLKLKKSVPIKLIFNIKRQIDHFRREKREEFEKNN